MKSRSSLTQKAGLARCLLAGVALATTALMGADWPQYRGPNHDGSSPEAVRTNWSANPPRVLWRRAVEPAWCSMSVSGGRVFTQANRRINGQAREVCVALDAASGAQLWATALDVADYPDGGTGSNDGPRSTPTVDGDRVFVLTSYLKLHCLDARSGSVVWSRDFIAENPGARVIAWQNAASPLVVGDLIYLNSNVPGRSLTAVRKSDGTTAWGVQSDLMTHATPTFAAIDGVPQVVFLTGSGLAGLEPETGSVLWRHSFAPSATSTAASPVVGGNVVYASSAYALGAWTARVGRVGTQFVVSQPDFKRSSAHQNHWASPVHHEGHVYGIVERSLRSLACMDLAGRTNRWTTSTVGSGNPGFGTVIKAGRHLLVLTERGELVLVDPSPAAYRELARFQATASTCWNHPALANGRLYVRASTEAIALDLAPPFTPLPSYRVAAAGGTQPGHVRVQVLGDGPLGAPEAARLRLESALPRLPLAWDPLPAVLRPVGQQLEADVATGGEARLIRAAEVQGP